MGPEGKVVHLRSGGGVPLRGVPRNRSPRQLSGVQRDMQEGFPGT